MNIAYCASSIIPGTSANSIQVMRMCQAFAKNGHHVVLYARRGGAGVVDTDAYRFYGVDRVFGIELVATTRLRGIAGPLFGHRIAARVRRRSPPPDVIYGRDLYSLLACSDMNIPLYYEVHVAPSTRLRRILEGRLLRKRNLVRLVSISRPLRDEYLRLFPWLTAKETLVAADGAEVPSTGCPRRELPGGQGSADGVLRVGYAGSLFPGRGIEIIAALSAALPEMSFHVLGGSTAELATWQARHGTPNLHFHGRANPCDVGPFLASCDVLLAPYQERVTCSPDGRGDIARWFSPLKISEYMSHGKAIVASHLTALEDVLVDGDNALLVAPESVVQWRDALVRLARDTELRRRLGDSAFADFLNHYNLAQRARAVIAPSLPGIGHGNLPRAALREPVG